MRERNAIDSVMRGAEIKKRIFTLITSRKL